MRSFEMSQTVTRKLSQFFFGRCCSLFEYHEGLRSFSPALMWQTHNRDLLDSWVAQQYALNLYRRDILTATHDFRRCLRILIVALHYGVPPHDDLTKRHAIMRDLSSGFINYAQFTRR